MKHKYLILSFFFIFPLLQINAQDTLTVMYYNILNYVPSNAENVRCITNITKYIKPDVMVLNEVSNDSSCTHLLDSVLNTDGTMYYEKADFTDGPDSDNMLYYNHEKVLLISQDTIQTDLRIINEYTLYYNNDIFTSQYDSVLFNFYSAHLKSSTGSSNEQQRLVEVQKFIQHLYEGDIQKNILFGGDMNFYSSTEPALEYLVAPGSYQMFDPLDSIGDWHDNPIYSHIHTQSTRTASFGGGATGGMDDRFDFIFASSDIMSGLNYAKYIPGTYCAFGNDGHHLNVSLTTLPQYNNLPDSITESLYLMSDHLPVVMKILISYDAKIPEQVASPTNEIKIFPNPASEEITIAFSKLITSNINYTIETPEGRTEKNGIIFSNGYDNYKLKINDLNEGVHFIRLEINGTSVTGKICISR